MEDAASEISDWEVLSAASDHGGDEGDFVVLVSGEGGGGGNVLHDHFALAPSDAGFPGEGEGEGEGLGLGALADDEGEGEGLDLVDGLDSISGGRLDLVVEEDWSEELRLCSGVDETSGESSVLETTLSGEERREEAVGVGIEQEKDAAHSCGELEFAPREVHRGTGENLDSDATVDADVSQFESPENSYVQLEDGGVDVAGGSSLPASSAIGDAMGTADGEPVQAKSDNAASGCGELDGEVKDGSLPLAQSLAGESSLPEAAAVIGTVEEGLVEGNSGNAASGCGEPDGEAKDGSSPLAQAPGAGEGERQVVVWWRLPFRLLQCCAWKVKPIWSFSIAAALLGLLVLGRRMYRMRRKAQGLPQIKIAFDDKKASQFADRTARLNEALFVARRIPMLRTSSGAVFPWSMVQER